MFDTTVNLFNLGAAVVTIAAFIIGGFKFVYRVEGSTQILGVRLVGVENEMKKLVDVNIRMAENKGRMDLIEERQLAQGKRLDASVDAINKQLLTLTELAAKGH